MKYPVYTISMDLIGIVDVEIPEDIEQGDWFSYLLPISEAELSTIVEPKIITVREAVIEGRPPFSVLISANLPTTVLIQAMQS